jgi:Flp pilus assembly protein TadG
MSTRRPFASRERGSSLAEFAIAVTASLTLIMGIVDLGRGLYAYHMISNLARLGTRYAIVHGSVCSGCTASASTIQTTVRGLAPELGASGITVTTTWPPAGNCGGARAQGPGCPVVVQVAYSFRFAALPLLPNMTMPISSTSQMIISQ